MESRPPERGRLQNIVIFFTFHLHLAYGRDKILTIAYTGIIKVN